jgi:hypothetical protein
MRLRDSNLNANPSAGELSKTDHGMPEVMSQVIRRAGQALGDASVEELVASMLDDRRQTWLELAEHQHDYQLGYKGGAIRKVTGGHLLAAFSGGKDTDDLDVANLGLDLLEKAMRAE